MMTLFCPQSSQVEYWSVWSTTGPAQLLRPKSFILVCALHGERAVVNGDVRRGAAPCEEAILSRVMLEGENPARLRNA